MSNYDSKAQIASREYQSERAEEYQSGQTMEPIRKSVGTQVCQQGNMLADRAQKLVDRVFTKLQPVMRQNGPSTNDNRKEHVQEDYPPMFNDLRDSMDRIEQALNNIDEAISRTEL